MAFDSLFAPLKIKNLTLRNRFALAAMSRYSSPGAAGSHIGAQLWHHGALHPDKHYRPAPIESPSGLMQPGKKVGEPMTEAEGEAVIAAFAKGAVAAKELGFDIVEIHAAHGYLLDQFLWACTNERTDRWGGPRLVDRLRFVLDVTRAVRAAVGPEMVVAIRISQWKEQDYEAKPAAIDGLTERLEAGEFDLVAVGRALLVDPQWVQKVRDGSYARIEPFDKNKAERVY